MAEQTRKKGSFVKQAAILAFAGLLTRFLGFVYRLPLTNLIGDSGNAIYAGAYYIYTFLLILSSAGLPAAISKLVSERITLKQYRNAHRVFQVALCISSSMGLLFAVFLSLIPAVYPVLSPKIVVQYLLAHAQALRRHLQQLVLTDKLHALL